MKFGKLLLFAVSVCFLGNIASVQAEDEEAIGTCTTVDWQATMPDGDICFFTRRSCRFTYISSGVETCAWCMDYDVPGYWYNPYESYPGGCLKGVVIPEKVGPFSSSGEPE